MPTLLTSIQQISTIYASDAPPLATRCYETAATQAQFEREASAYPPKAALGDDVGSSLSRNSIPDQFIKFEMKTKLQTCKPRCICQCHIPFKASTPRWLRAFVGVAFIKITGAPGLNRRRCDYKNCGYETHKTGSIRCQYLFPLWLVKAGLGFTASWRSVTGIGGKWTFRIPRTIGDDVIYHTILASIEIGSLEDTQRIMQTYGIRAFDTFPSFLRSSLFTVRRHHYLS
jgi:hypothetical protein